MSIEGLIFWALLGIAFVWLAITRWRLRPPVVHFTKEAAASAFLQIYPKEHVITTHLANDGKGAWFELADVKNIGVMTIVCGRYACKRIELGNVKRVEKKGPRTVELTIREYGFPRCVLDFRSGGDADFFCQLLRQRAA